MNRRIAWGLAAGAALALALTLVLLLAPRQANPLSDENESSSWSVINNPLAETNVPPTALPTSTPTLLPTSTPTPGIDPALCNQHINPTTPFEQLKFDCRLKFLRADAIEVKHLKGLLEEPNKQFYRQELASLELWLDNNHLSQADLTRGQLALADFRHEFDLRSTPVPMPTVTSTATVVPNSGQNDGATITQQQLLEMLKDIVVIDCTKKTCNCPPGKHCLLNDPSP